MRFHVLPFSLIPTRQIKSLRIVYKTPILQKNLLIINIFTISSLFLNNLQLSIPYSINFPSRIIIPLSFISYFISQPSAICLPPLFVFITRQHLEFHFCFFSPITITRPLHLFLPSPSHDITSPSPAHHHIALTRQLFFKPSLGLFFFSLDS
jgi:hypothetical protein